MEAVLDTYGAEAERVGAGHRSSDPAWLADARRHALERFLSLGFPTTRDEDWRFTSVAPIAERSFTLMSHGASTSTLDLAELAPFHLPGEVAATLVFVNGRYEAASSRVHRLPRGVRINSLARALSDPGDEIEGNLTRIASADRHAFTALNTAMLVDGALVSVPESTVVEAPIHLMFVSVDQVAPTMAHPRVLIVMGASSQASVVESYVGLGAREYFTNTVTEVMVGENATLHHYKNERENSRSYHVGALYLRGARDANVACHSISLGGSLVRNDVIAVLDGEGATCTLNGLYLSDGTRLVDNHTTIDHARPHCASREVYKGILADQARAVFNGKIIVRPDAQKTDAKQTNKALLLSEDAQINTKPQLEIFANDVKCTHGAAIGQMDDEAIFYLRARGIGDREARHLLVRAFASDVLNQMPLESLRTQIDEELMRRLPRWRA
jgi:Fe-S cluster assembly protein SufD